MLDKRFVEEYKKIKPDDGLKTRIMCNVASVAKTPARKPLYVSLRPVLSGALACVLALCFLTFIPFDPLQEGDVSVAYAQTGEFIAPLSLSRSYGIAMCDNMLYEYSRLPDGKEGAEFTFEFGGKTELKTEYGSIYQKNDDGSYTELGNKTKIDGTVTLFWVMPDGENDGECVMTIRNRSGELNLSLERFDGEYKANLVLAE